MCIYISYPDCKEITNAATSSSSFFEEKSCKKKNEILKAFLKSLDESSNEEGSEATYEATIDPKWEYFGHVPLVADDFPRLKDL